MGAVIMRAVAYECICKRARRGHFQNCFATDLLSFSMYLFAPRAPAVPAENGHALQLPVPSVSLYVPGFRLIRNVMAENERNVTQACWRNYEQDPYLSDSYVPNVIVHACAHRPHQQDSLNMTETRSAT